jgi:glyoxylase-like metal-dependent hydrolase (beta-lactamase superfamily II)
VIERPLGNRHTNAVIAEAHKQFPNKPIRYLVNTHNHFDHLGRVRGYVAEGANCQYRQPQPDLLLAYRLRAAIADAQLRQAVYEVVCAHGSRDAEAADVHGSVHDRRWQ